MKGELEELGEEVGENVDSISKVQTQILNLTKGKVNIFDDAGQFRDYYEIMQDIANEWDKLNSIDRSNLSEILFGKMRGNQGQALIQAFQSGQITKALETAQKSAGSAMAEQEKWMESLEAKLGSLDAVIQSISNNILDSDLLKGGIDLLTEILSIIDQITDSLGSVGTLLVVLPIGIFAGGAVNELVRLATAAAKTTEGFNLLGSIGPALKVGLGGVSKAAGGAAKMFSKLWGVISSHPIISIIALLAALAAALHTSASEAAEKFETAVSEYDTAKQKVVDVNTELEATKTKIDELQRKGGLTFVEQAELERLQSVTKELELQKQLAEWEEERAAKEVARTATQLYEKKYGSFWHGGRIDANQIEDQINTYYDFDGNYDLTLDDNDLNSLIAAQKIYAEKKTEAYEAVKEIIENDIPYDELTKEQQRDFNLWKRYRLEGEKVTDTLRTAFAEIDELKNSLEEVPYDSLPENQKDALDAITADWEYLYQLLDPAGWKTIKFDEIFENKEFAKQKEQLIELAKLQNGLDTGDYEYIANRYKELVEALVSVGIKIPDLVNQINSEAGSINIEVALDQTMADYYEAIGVDPNGENNVDIGVNVEVTEPTNDAGMSASELLSYLTSLSEEDQKIFFSLGITTEELKTLDIASIKQRIDDAKKETKDTVLFSDMIDSEDYQRTYADIQKKAEALQKAIAGEEVDYNELSQAFNIPITAETTRAQFIQLLAEQENIWHEFIVSYANMAADEVEKGKILSQEANLSPLFDVPAKIDRSVVDDAISNIEKIFGALEDGITSRELMELSFAMPELNIDFTVPEDQYEAEAQKAIEALKTKINKLYDEAFYAASDLETKLKILEEQKAVNIVLGGIGIEVEEFDFDDTSELRGIVSGLQDKLEQVLSGELTEAEKSSMVVDLLEDHKDALLGAGITDLNTSNLEESLNTLIKAYQDQIVEALKAAREALDDGDHIEEVKLLDQAITAYEEEILANMPTAKEHKLDTSAISGYMSDIEGMFSALKDGISGLELYELSLKYPELNIDYTVPEAQYEAEIQKAIAALKASIESVYNKMIESARTFADKNYWYKQKQGAMIQIEGIGIEVKEFDSSVISDLRGNINDLQNKLIEVYSDELTDSEKANMATELWEDYWQDFQDAGIEKLDASNLEEGIKALMAKYRQDIDSAFREAIDALMAAGDLDSANRLQKFWESVSASMYSMSDADLKKEAFDEGIVDDYVSNIESLYDALGKIRDGEFSSEDLFNLQKVFGDAINPDDLEGSINQAIVDISSKLDAAYDQLYALTQDPKWLALKESANAMFADMALSLNATFDIDAEVEGFNALYDAIGATNDALGVNAETVQMLTERYRTLKDFNVDELFEYTSSGIHVNTKYAHKLEKAYQDLTKVRLEKQLEDLREELERNQGELRRTGKLSEGMRETDAIIKDIQNVQSLVGEYDGLISKYNRWKQLQSQPDTGSQFRDIVEGKEELDVLAKEGAWGSQYLQSYLDMFSYTPIEDYEAKYKSLDDTIKGTSFSLSDFIKGGGEGVTNLLKAMEQIDPESINFDGNQWNINATAAEMELLASRLGVSTEFIEHAFEQIRYLGGDLQIIDAVDDLESFAEKADIVNEALKEVGEEPLKINFEANTIEDIDTEIGKIKKSIGDLIDVNESGEITLKPGVSQADYNFAMDMLEYMAQKKAELVAPGLMSIQVDASDGLDEVEKAVLLMQQLNTQFQIGTDTKEAQTEIQNILTQLNGLSGETKAKLGLDTDEFTTAANSLSQTEIQPGVSMNSEDVATIQSTLTGISADIIATVSVNDDQAKNYSAPNKHATVIYNVNDRKVSSYDPPDKYATVHYSYKTHGASPVNGTAHNNGTAFIQGTAYRHGDWGTKGSGVALGGELGMETVVRDGRYYTIGDNGAEFFQYKKGDIIFNHKQTEELFKYGKVTSGGGRGKAFVDGTAFAKDYTGSWGGASGSSNSSSSSGGGKKPSSSSSSSSSDDAKEIFDWIEIAIDRIERKIESLGRKAENVFKSWNDRNDKLRDQMQEVAAEIELQNEAANRYLEEANSVGLDEEYAKLVREGAIDIESITDEDLAEKIAQYQEWYEKYLDCIDAAEELAIVESELYQQAFDNIATQYDAFIAMFEQEQSMLEAYISQAEAMGQMVSADYYQALIASEQEEMQQLHDQRDELIDSLNDAVSSGAIAEGSEAWYEMMSQINDVTLAIEESESAIIDYNNAIQEIEWQIFDLMQEKISQLTAEADFLIDLLDNNDLFDESGVLTDEGMAAMAMHGMNYNAYMQQADQYAQEMASINAQLANDPNNQNLLDRRQELLELQQESILAAEDEKQAIIDMVSEGIQMELDAMQELIDSYVEALDSQKDLYDYQKKIKKQTEEIASIEKQLAAYSGDNSEEARAKIQELKLSLEEAQENLDEMEYDRYISDQKKLLDDLYNEYEEGLNARLDDIDTLIADMIDDINSNSSSINSTISEVAESVGYTLSESMADIWESASDGDHDALSLYGEAIQDGIISGTTTLNHTLTVMNSNLQNMIDQLNILANSNIASNPIDASETNSYANGARRIAHNEMAWTQENHAREAIIRPSDGAILTPLAQGDVVLSSKATNNMFDFMNDPTKFIRDSLNINASQSEPPVVRSQNVSSTNTVSVEIILPNVTNYDEFKQKMQRDKSFENMMRAMTTDRMFGGSSLKKYRY